MSGKIPLSISGFNELSAAIFIFFSIRYAIIPTGGKNQKKSPNYIVLLMNISIFCCILKYLLINGYVTDFWVSERK